MQRRIRISETSGRMRISRSLWSEWGLDSQRIKLIERIFAADYLKGFFISLIHIIGCEGHLIVVSALTC
jgi:hypothetical protein